MSELEEKKQGLFKQSIDRNPRQIRQDRGDIMLRSSKSLYKGKIDKLYLDKDKLEIDRNNSLDFGGESTTAIISPDKFDAEVFVQSDAELTMKMREINIRIEEYEKRYLELYGTRYTRDV